LVFLWGGGLVALLEYIRRGRRASDHFDLDLRTRLLLALIDIKLGESANFVAFFVTERWLDALAHVQILLR